MAFTTPKRTSIPAYGPKSASKPSGNYTKGRLKTVRVLVVHDGETGEGTTPAEGMGRWFQDPDAKGSAHAGFDTDSICTYVQDGDTAWGAPGANADGLHGELAGRAGQTASQWTDAASLQIIENAAIWYAEKAVKFKIPVRFLTDSQLRDGVTKGFASHRQCTRVFGGSHTDPGPNFPSDYFLSRVRHHVSRITGVTTPVFKVGPTLNRGDSGPVVRKLQIGLNKVMRTTLVPDGRFGPKTEGVVRKYQTSRKLSVDGRVGPKTQARLFKDGVRLY